MKRNEPKWKRQMAKILLQMEKEKVWNDLKYGSPPKNNKILIKDLQTAFTNLSIVTTHSSQSLGALAKLVGYKDE